MSKKTQHGACIKPKHTNLKRNPDPRLSAEVIGRLSNKFGFRADYDLHGALGEAIASYRKLTCQTLLQRRKQHSLTKRWLRKASKHAQRDDGKLFRTSLKKMLCQQAQEVQERWLAGCEAWIECRKKG